MKYIKRFEKIEGRFKKGDIVYPRPEQTGKFNVLKPIAYKVQNVINQFDQEYLVLDNIDPTRWNEFPSEFFLTELEYKQNQFNL